MSKYDVEVSEEWLLFFEDKEESMMNLKDLIQKKQEALPNSNEAVKLSAEIRRKFQREDRDLVLLKNGLKKLKDITNKEKARRKDDLDRLINHKNKLLESFNQGTSVKKSNKNTDYSNVKDDEYTRDMSNQQLLDSQKHMIKQQDDSLDVLSDALDRTKNIGVAIGDELNEHQRLLGDLEDGVGRTKGNLQRQQKRLDGVLKASGIGCLLCTIVILIIIAIVLFVLMVTIVVKF
eukprot:gene6171-10178_t